MWWGLWLGSGVAGRITRFLPDQTIWDWKILTVCSMVIDLLLIVLGLAAIKLLKTVVANQDILVGENRGAPAPEPPRGAPRNLRERSIDESDPY